MNDRAHRLSKAKITKFGNAIAGDEDILELEVEMGKAYILVQSLDCFADLLEDMPCEGNVIQAASLLDKGQHVHVALLECGHRPVTQNVTGHLTSLKRELHRLRHRFGDYDSGTGLRESVELDHVGVIDELQEDVDLLADALRW